MGERGRKGTPPGNLYECETKEVAGKAIRKTMKTKGYQIDHARGAVCKVMKTKDRQNEGAWWVARGECWQGIGVHCGEAGRQGATSKI
jgi:hypothetical protein